MLLLAQTLLHSEKDKIGPSDCTPEGGFSFLTKSGGKFGTANPKTELETLLYAKKDVPAPGLKHAKWSKKQRGGTGAGSTHESTATRKTHLEALMREAAVSDALL